MTFQTSLDVLRGIIERCFDLGVLELADVPTWAATHHRSEAEIADIINSVKASRSTAVPPYSGEFEGK